MGSNELAQRLKRVALRSVAVGVALEAAMLGGAGAASAQSVLAPVNLVRPTVSGTTQVGSTLSTTNGTWAGISVNYTYLWFRCPTASVTSSCAQVNGAQSNTYKLVLADSQRWMVAAVVAYNDFGQTSVLSNVVGPVRSPPVNTARPTISGTVRQGQMLTATSGTWTGVPAPTYAYRWEACYNDPSLGICGLIDPRSYPGADTASFRIPKDSEGTHWHDTYFRVRVTATNVWGSAVAWSEYVGPTP